MAGYVVVDMRHGGELLIRCVLEEEEEDQEEEEDRGEGGMGSGKG